MKVPKENVEFACVSRSSFVSITVSSSALISPTSIFSTVVLTLRVEAFEVFWVQRRATFKI
ncbi:hypothetical protein LguiA_011663 [Lonicera macranthoides]